MGRSEQARDGVSAGAEQDPGLAGAQRLSGEGSKAGSEELREQTRKSGSLFSTGSHEEWAKAKEFN